MAPFGDGLQFRWIGRVETFEQLNHALKARLNPVEQIERDDDREAEVRDEFGPAHKPTRSSDTVPAGRFGTRIRGSSN